MRVQELQRPLTQPLEDRSNIQHPSAPFFPPYHNRNDVPYAFVREAMTAWDATEILRHQTWSDDDPALATLMNDYVNPASNDETVRQHRDDPVFLSYKSILIGGQKYGHKRPQARAGTGWWPFEILLVWLLLGMFCRQELPLTRSVINDFLLILRTLRKEGIIPQDYYIPYNADQLLTKLNWLCGDPPIS